MTVLQDYSVVLVIPDYYDRLYVEALVRILLVDMGFKQFCAQQVLPYPARVLPPADNAFLTGIVSCDLWCRYIQCLRSRYGRGQDEHCLCRRWTGHRGHEVKAPFSACAIIY